MLTTPQQYGPTRSLLLIAWLILIHLCASHLQANPPTPSAAQRSYEPYGDVVAAEHLHSFPVQKVGHKGLFVDRLDAAITGHRIVPFGHGVYHNRNRVYVPALGRFLQQDPNQTAMLVNSVLVMHGGLLFADPGGFDLGGVYGDGFNLHQYVGSNPIANSDPTGLFIGNLWEAEKQGLAFLAGASDPAGILGSMLNQMVGQYASNQDWDVEWALDWSMSDNLHTRGSNRWVEVAMIIGAADHFGLGLENASGSGIAIASGIMPAQLASKGGIKKVLGAAERRQVANGTVNFGKTQYNSELTHGGRAYNKRPTIYPSAGKGGGPGVSNQRGREIVAKYTRNGVAIRDTTKPKQVIFIDPNMTGHGVKASLRQDGTVFKVDFLGPTSAH